MMIKINGLFNTAIVYAEELEESVERQIRLLCDQSFVEGSKIRIMPDVHTGIGGVIGTTMTLTDKVVPNLLECMEWTEEERFTTIHNYIDMDGSEDGSGAKNMILRKGAVSARAGERLLVSMNMRDGSLICLGKGNPEWNFSAPHGAGCLMSRTVAKERISMDEYLESMKGIFSTTVDRKTLDEAPMAYKPMESIIAQMQDTVMIERHIVPIYNFKAPDTSLGLDYNSISALKRSRIQSTE